MGEWSEAMQDGVICPDCFSVLVADNGSLISSEPAKQKPALFLMRNASKLGKTQTGTPTADWSGSSGTSGRPKGHGSCAPIVTLHKNSLSEICGVFSSAGQSLRSGVGS